MSRRKDKPRLTRTQRAMRLRRVIMAVLIIAAFVAANLRGGTVVYALMYCAILTPLISVGHTYFVFNSFKVVQTIDSRFAVKEQPTGYICTFSNESAMPYPRMRLTFFDDYSTVESSAVSEHIQLAPHSSKVIKGSLVCHCRGEHIVGLRTVSITDLLGLFEITYPIRIQKKIMVAPRIIPLRELSVFTLEGQRERPAHRGGDPVADNAVRAYESGDDIRLIHWKSSARTGELRTRVTTFPVRPRLAVIMPLTPAQGENAEFVEDCVIETTLAIANYAVERGIEAAVLLPGLDVPRVDILGDYDFRQFYELCRDVRFSRPLESFPFESLNGGYSVCAAVTTETDCVQLLEGLRSLTVGGSQCALLVCSGMDDAIADDTRTGTDEIAGDHAASDSTAPADADTNKPGIVNTDMENADHADAFAASYASTPTGNIAAEAEAVGVACRILPPRCDIAGVLQ